MRNKDGSLIGDLSDNVSAMITGSLAASAISDVNENDTNYTLLPTIYNQPPIITKSLIEGTIPSTKNYPQTYRSTYPTIIDGQIIEKEANIYKHLDGTIKVIVGTSFTITIEAKQPNTVNVENGIPKVIESTTGLTYAWFKDNVPIITSGVESTGMLIEVKENIVNIQNIHPLLGGDYICEVSNDVGTVVSDTLTIEVYDPNIDDFFNKNLIENPNGEEGTDGWIANNDDFITDNFTKTNTQQLLQPNRVDLFGYNPDTMHPRPYQINTGGIKNLNYIDSFINNKAATYFTRTKYEYEAKGGTFLVKAYQDVDVSDLDIFIRGGVYGVSGVRAIFGCYIGNAVNSFIPTKELLEDPKKATSEKSYFMERPRISPENFVYAGSALKNKEQAYIIIEELSENAKVVSTLLREDNNNYYESIATEPIKILDPWSKRLNKYHTEIDWSNPTTTDAINTQYYNGQGALASRGLEPLQYFKDRSVGSASPADGTDAVLLTAEELYPDRYERFTYGQYVEFNKTILAKLNDKTTKIRITLNYETQDPRIFDKWKEALDATDKVLEFTNYQGYAESMKWGYTGRIDDIIDKKDKASILQVYNLANSPRGMITGLNLSLIPILTFNKELTDSNTRILLSKNNNLKTILPRGLVY